MRNVGLDPPFTDVQYIEWDATATRPLTQAAIGARSSAKRQRDATLSKLFTPERNFKMIRRAGRTTLAVAKS